LSKELTSNGKSGIFMEEDELKTIASQLSCPQGEDGIEMGNKMNNLNAFITQRTIETLSPLRGEIIAELGPGNGALSEPLLDSLGKSGKYYGIEPSEIMTNEITLRFSEKSCDVQIIHGDHLNADIPDKSIDGLFAVNVLYFIENLNEFFQQIRNWMKPGARAVFGVRSDNALNNLPFIEYGFNVRNPDDIKQCMRRNAFSDVDSTYHDEGTVLLGDIPLPVDSVIIKGKI
jgi:SAM-dependent methyltransferase